jgi:osomolarity two-component system response regulator SSK1
MKRKKIKYDLASNGQEAVQKWRTGGFHLILVRFAAFFFV